MSGALVLSFKAQGVLAAQRGVVAVSSTAQTVGYPEAGTVLPVGILLDAASSSSDTVAVQVNGKAKLYFNDTVTSGKLVALDTSGRGIPFTPASTSTGLTLPTGVIGTLIDAKVDLTGTVAQVLIQPQLIR